MDPEINFVFLVSSAYDNSESFFSNSTDYGIVLRDYVDLYCFIRNYEDTADWSHLVALSEELDLSFRLGVVLGNLEALFGSDAACGCFEGVVRESSVWGVGIECRLGNPNLAREAAYAKIRSSLIRNSFNLTITDELEDGTSLSDVDTIGIKVALREDQLLVQWEIDKRFVSDEHMLQIQAFPLTDRNDMLVYKADLSVYGGVVSAYGHKSSRIVPLAAIKKRTMDALKVREKTLGNKRLFDIEIPSRLSKIDWRSEVERGSVAISAGFFHRNHSNVFWNVAAETVELTGCVPMGCVAILTTDGRCASLPIHGNQTISIAFEDECLGNDFLRIFPHAVNGWTLSASGSRTSSIVVAGSRDGFYSVSKDRRILGELLSRDEAAGVLLQNLTDTAYNVFEDHLVAIHAATSRTADGVILFVGLSGCGKTSLCVAYSKYEQFMGDECAFVDFATGKALCEEMPFVIKESNRDTLCWLDCARSLRTESAGQERALYFPRKCIDSDQNPMLPGKISYITFPKYSPTGSGTTIRSVSFAEIMLDVLQSIRGKRKPSVLLKSFVEMVARHNIPMLRLDYANAADAAHRLNDYIKAGGSL